MKKIITTILAGLVLFTGTAFAKDFDWSETWCNYGANIEEGDKILTLDAGMPWEAINYWNKGWVAFPSITADFEVAVPVWKLPFTFGGYVATRYSKVPEGDAYYSHFYLGSGASATYHVMMPIEGLDLYAGNTLGFKVDFSQVYPNNAFISFDWGFNIGASYYFNDNLGLNLEIGYPYTRFGVAFKF